MANNITNIKWLGISTICALGLLAMGVLCATEAQAGAAKPNRYAWLADVSHWLYLIDVDVPQSSATQDKIVKSSYDMVVLDYITSERCNTTFDMAPLVKKLHDAYPPKLVIAYIDANQAEWYREYWPKPKPSDPCDVPDENFKADWLIKKGDPDGWSGVFNVAFWYPDYKEIWLGKSGKKGYLKGILDAGFDGVYIDWVEAYEDKQVSDKALADCKKSSKNCICKTSPTDCISELEQEMIKWIGEIASFTRAQEPDFLVIAQNAAELAQDSTYVSIIDAIAQEQVWFDGGADGIPLGDCPLPRTDAEVSACGTPIDKTWITCPYYLSLSSDCRTLYEKFPYGTLHISSDEYLSYLKQAKSKGLRIFTADYATVPKNVAWVYEKSRSEGFVPFVGNRKLNTFQDPVPYVLKTGGTSYALDPNASITYVKPTSNAPVTLKGPPEKLGGSFTIKRHSPSPFFGGEYFLVTDMALKTASGKSFTLESILSEDPGLTPKDPVLASTGGVPASFLVNFTDDGNAAPGIVLKGTGILPESGFQGFSMEETGLMNDPRFVGHPANPTGFDFARPQPYTVTGAGLYEYRVEADPFEPGGLSSELRLFAVANFMASQDSEALYVWRDPKNPLRTGTPITLTEAVSLADFAVAKGISTVYYDFYGCGPTPSCPDGSEQQGHEILEEIIALLHDHGLRVEALCTDYNQISDAVTYNKQVSAKGRFDGIRFYISAPIMTVPDLKDLAAVVAAETLPIYASIGRNWISQITYNGQTKEVFKHIMDIVDGVDVRTLQDTAKQIVQDTKDEICYANSFDKLVHVTIETYKAMGAPNTFYEEGEVGMKKTLDALNYTAACSSGSDGLANGFAYHFYRQSFGSVGPVDFEDWLSDIDEDGIIDAVDLRPILLSDGFSDVDLGGKTAGAITKRGDRDWLINDHEDTHKGVKIIIGKGTKAAQIKGSVGGPCKPKTTIDINDPNGDTITFTCSSTTVEIAESSAVVTASANGHMASVTVSAGGGVTFDLTDDGALVVTNTGTTPLSGDILVAASKDSFLSRRRPNRNQGAKEVLVVKNGKRTVVSFDLSGVPPDAVITNTTLVMTIAKPVRGCRNKDTAVYAQRLLEPFTEGKGLSRGYKKWPRMRDSGAGVTWNCGTDADISNREPDCDSKWKGGARSAAPPAAYGVLHIKGMTGEVEWDVTDDVLDALAEGVTEVGWVITPEKKRRRAKVVYYSNEGAAAAGDPSLAPRLILEFEL